MDEKHPGALYWDVSAFPEELRQLIHEVEEASSVKTGMVLNLAMNYGGRAGNHPGGLTCSRRWAAGRRRPGGLDRRGVRPVSLHRRPARPDLIIAPAGRAPV